MVHQTISNKTVKAPRASSKINPMECSFLVAQNLKPTANRSVWWQRAGTILGLALVAACAAPPPHAVPDSPIAATTESPTKLFTDSTNPVPQVAASWIPRERSRWVGAAWNDLPGWGEDQAQALWPALLRSCERPASAWAAACAAAVAASPASDEAARAWLEQWLRPYRVESLAGSAQGLATGYFEPQIKAARQPDQRFRWPLYGLPADLQTRSPYWTRQELESLPSGKAAPRVPALAWLEDPLDGLIVQVQGSGRVDLTEPNGDTRSLRLAFAGHNNQPYRSVGRWLIDQGQLNPDQASWSTIRNWLRLNPERTNELLWSNPRVVFFREEPLLDPNLGPRGAQGVPLTPGRSIAVDAQSIPYGTVLWLDSTDPLSNQALRRLVVAQDTGGAIVGAVRADFFWGWGDAAQASASAMKHPMRLWALWPR